MANSQLNVAVTGAAGYIGSRSIAELCGDDRVARVLAFDLQRPAFSHPKLVFDELDVRSDALQARLGGVDVVVHLAFIMDPIHDETLMRDVNVNGTQNVLRCAGKAGVSHVVYTSSGVAYGAHPDNDVPLTEEAPLRANLDFNYAAHKLEAEYVVKEFRSEYPDVSVTVFRPAIVFGPHANNAWSHQFEAPVIARIKGYDPELQFVHEDDVVRALATSVHERWDGAYNLAAPGGIPFSRLIAITGRPTTEVPEQLAFVLQDRMWQMNLAEAPAGMVHYAMYPWVMSVEKLAEAGFTTRRSNLETFVETAQRMHPYVRLGRRRLPRTSLNRGAVALAGLAGAAAATRIARKALSRR